MTIKYLDSKRISALSSDGEGLTFSDDFSTDDWTTSSSSVIGVSGGVLNWSVPNGSVQEQQSYVDMLGSLINTTQWSIRFKLTVSGYVQGSSAQTQQLFFGISNESSSGHTNTQDIIGLKLTLTNTISTIGVQMKNATPSNTGNTSNVSTALSAGTWYVEINRLNLTQSKITLYSDSSYSQLVSTATETYSTNALNDLRYLKCSEYSNNAGTDHTLSGTIDDVSFYNGLTSIVKPTNVQDGTIFVEKEIAKRHTFNQYPTSFGGGEWVNNYGYPSMYESFNTLKTVNKQHFVEWFSGSALDSIWTLSNINGGTTGAMDDSVDGGYKISFSTQSSAWGGLTMSNIRQYAHNGSVAIGVVKKTFGTGAGGGHFGLSGTLDTSQGQTAACQFDSGQDANFALRTEAASGSSTPSSMVLDENWHSTEIHVQSSSVDLTIDGTVEVTRSTTLPTTSMQPIYYGIKRSTDAGDYISIRYCEAYNT